MLVNELLKKVARAHKYGLWKRPLYLKPVLGITMFFGAIVFLFTGKTATPAKTHSLISVHVPNLEVDLGKATWSTSNDWESLVPCCFGLL